MDDIELAMLAIASHIRETRGEFHDQERKQKWERRVAAEIPPPPAPILISSEIDGLAHTTYEGGIVDGELPDGTVKRFSSLAEYREACE